jgi:hypothetical protein
MLMRCLSITIPVAVLVASCQTKDHSARHDVIAGSAVSRAEPQPVRPEPPPARAPKLPNPLPGVRKDVTAIVGAAVRVAIGDLDGDGASEIVLVDPQQLRVVTPAGRELASVQVPGGIQVLVVADLDGDHHAEILAGYGMSREHMDATAQVVLYRYDHGALAREFVLAPKTTRAEIVEIVPIAEEKSAILIGYFESKYMVNSVIARRTAAAWTTSDIASIRMGTSYARGDVDGDGKPDLVVGRVYGDDKGIDGDAFVLAPAGARVPVPTTRGVRSIAISDLDADGHPEIFVADGWHQNYAQNGRGLLTWIRHTDQGFKSDLIEDTAGQYTVGRILPATIGGHGVLITSGNLYVRAFRHIKGVWQRLTIAAPGRDLAVGDLDGVAGDEVLVIGERSEIINLRDVAWP